MSAAPRPADAIRYTIFPNRFAGRKQDQAEPWELIVERLNAPRVALEKEQLPLLSLGVYGNKRTDKGALRSQENLRCVTGIEGDYDGEVVTLEEAAEKLRMAGIRCALYTSPSHKPDKPRWRVLAPLSQEYPQSERARFVARVNGIVDGILTGESFTASQSFYFGRVAGCEYKVIHFDGDPIDQRDEFDAHAVMPTGKSVSPDGKTPAVANTMPDEELRQSIRKGENFHESLRSLSARLVGRGMKSEDVQAALQGLMEESTESGTARWQERYDAIPRLVKGAADKYRDPRQPVEMPKPPADQFPTIDVIVEGGDAAIADHLGDDSDDDTMKDDDVLELLAFDVDALLGPIEPERELLPGIPAEAYTVIAGGLASAKTTLLHSLQLARATGYDFLRLNDTGIDVGPCVLVSYEDADRRIFRRFQILVQYQHTLIRATHGVVAAAEYLARVGRNLGRITLTGKAGMGIVCRGPNGNVLPNHALLDELVGKVRGFATSDVLIGLDPLRLAIVGSQSDDDGADVVVHVLNDLASRLPNSALVVPSHTTKAGAIEPGRSQAAAAYSTAGSALYSQHARSNFLMSRLSPDEAHKTFGADEVTREEIEGQRIVQLTHARLSHGPESKARFYVMRNGVLVPVRPSASELPLAELARRSLAAVYSAIVDIQGRGLTVSRKALEGVTGIARTRQERRAYIDECFSQGWLIEAGSTTNKRIELTPAGRAQLSPNQFGESEGKAA